MMWIAEIAMWVLATLLITGGFAAIIANAFFGYPDGD